MTVLAVVGWIALGWFLGLVTAIWIGFRIQRTKTAQMDKARELYQMAAAKRAAEVRQ